MCVSEVVVVVAVPWYCCGGLLGAGSGHSALVSPFSSGHGVADGS